MINLHSTPLMCKPALKLWILADSMQYFKLFALSLSLPSSYNCFVLCTQALCLQKNKGPLHGVCSRATS